MRETSDLQTQKRAAQKSGPLSFLRGEASESGSFRRHEGIKRRKAPEQEPFKDYLGIGLLSHVKMRSIMGDEALNFRVRNGIGCTRFSMDTKEIFQNI